MKTKHSNLPAVILSAIACVAAFTVTSQAQIVAYDDANLSAYTGVGGGWPGVNGGFGYDNWTALSDTGGGGTYMESFGAQVDNPQSFALYAGSGSYDISRQLVNPVPVGSFSILTRFNIPGTGNNLVNLRSGNNLGAFGGGELLSFGIVNDNQLSYTDSTGFHVLPSGEARGAAWNWNVSFNGVTGAYTLSVNNMGGGYSTTISGTMEQTGTSLDSFAVINSSTGNNNNVIFDAPTVTAAPEPSTLALLGIGAAGAFFLRRRRK